MPEVKMMPTPVAPFWITAPILLLVFLAGLLTGALLVAAFRTYWTQRRNSTSLAPETASPLVTISNAISVPDSEPEASPASLVEYLDSAPAGLDIVSDELRLSPQLLSGLQLFVQQAPPQIALAAQASGQYVLKFSSSTQALLNSQSAAIMRASGGGYRAIAQRVDGQIVEHGRLNSAARIGTPAAALAVWQILSIVTAQKYLSDINVHLERIELGVKGIQDWLETNRSAGLTAAIKYIAEWARIVDSMSLGDYDLHALSEQIELIERECRQVVDASSVQLRRATERFQRLRLTGMGLRKHYEAAEAILTEGSRQAEVSVLASYTRAVALRLRAALPLNPEVTQRRARNILAVLDEQQEVTARFAETVGKRIPLLQGRFSRASKDRRLQRDLHDAREVSLRPVAETAQMASTHVSSLAALANQDATGQDAPVVFTLSCGSAGEITAVRVIRTALPVAG
jgi:hypothetical protein